MYAQLCNADRCLHPALQQCEAGKAGEPRDVLSGHGTCFAFYEARQNVDKMYKEFEECKRETCSVEARFQTCSNDVITVNRPLKPSYLSNY